MGKSKRYVKKYRIPVKLETETINKIKQILDLNIEQIVKIKKDKRPDDKYEKIYVKHYIDVVKKPTYTDFEVSFSHRNSCILFDVPLISKIINDASNANVDIETLADTKSNKTNKTNKPKKITEKTKRIMDIADKSLPRQNNVMNDGLVSNDAVLDIPDIEIEPIEDKTDDDSDTFEIKPTEEIKPEIEDVKLDDIKPVVDDDIKPVVDDDKDYPDIYHEFKLYKETVNKKEKQETKTDYDIKSYLPDQKLITGVCVGILVMTSLNRLKAN